MNRDKLKNLLDALSATIDEVRPELEKGVDPLVVLIYHSRRAYDAASLRKGTNKVAR